uniref:Transcription activator GCR1-like domain-containing protein n=1 Tax=Skeletonema marinoi TaxID=267567 RepID=A0A7S2KS93_9STRA|mmetsp:Transcript_16055/g.27110  ORF Transcript_16055/g.27110 Transcript_16055/m.27110 type:complete len:743 (+) Transcript_16055:67-2295(+)
MPRIATKKATSKKLPASRGRPSASKPRAKYAHPPQPTLDAVAAVAAASIAGGGDIDNLVEGDGWEFPRYDVNSLKHNEKRYFTYFMEFMTFFHARDEVYPKTTVFTRADINKITPKAVHDWLAITAFGKADYGQGDKSEGARRSAMEYRKKSVSYFMTSKREWCEGKGNPTRSVIINKLLSHVGLLQTRGLGSKSCAKRKLTKEEFKLEMKLMRAENDWEHRIKYPTMSIWQFNFIGRIDDTTHHEVTDPKGHKIFPFALQSKVRWSKNVFEEKRCPDQIILGAADPDWCLQLLLSIYLESYLEQHPHAKYLFTELEQIDPKSKEDRAPINLKNRWRTQLKKIVWSRPEFEDIECEDDDDTNGGVGSHSRRKFAADYAANCGHSDYEIEIRARWKQSRSGKVIFFYIGLKKAFEDASVCATLCIGGPIKYELKEGTDASITPNWLYEHVIPNIKRRFHNDTKLCNVLGKALLYACMSDDPNITVPDILRNRVRSAYNSLGLEETQPVEKIPLHVHRLRDKLLISEVRAGSLVQGVDGRDGSGMTYPEAVQTLLLRQDQLELTMNQRFEGVSSQIHNLQNFNGKNFRLLNNNLRSYGGTIQGSFVQQRTREMRAQERHEDHDLLQRNDHLGEDTQAAVLSSNPTSLHALWVEYRAGLNGRKAAMNFTKSERNADHKTSQKYSRRNHIWKCIQRLCNNGMSSDVAIDRIRQTYGFTTSPSKIIDSMIDDKKRYKSEGGIHPTLR